MTIDMIFGQLLTDYKRGLAAGLTDDEAALWSTSKAKKAYEKMEEEINSGKSTHS